MTPKRCTDCRHTRGIGFDFWCGEGHTEYEVFGAETNCPYYEYHDWSKGVPSMTPKRFTYDKPLVAFSKGGISDNLTGETYEFTMDTVLDLLNQLNGENEELIKENKKLRDFEYFVFKSIGELNEKRGK